VSVKRAAAAAVAFTIASSLVGLAAEDDTVPALIQVAAGNGDFNDRQRASEDIQRLGLAAVPALTAALKAPEAPTRRVAGNLLAHIGAAAVAAVPALIETLNDPDAEARGEAIHALSAVGRRAQSAVPQLIRIARDARDANRGAAIEALGHLGRTRDIAPDLLRILTEPTPAPDPSAPKRPRVVIGPYLTEGAALRAAAAGALMQWDDLAAAPALLVAMTDDEKQVRLRAMLGLLRLLGREPDLLLRIRELANSERAAVRASAAEALAAGREDDPSVVETLAGLARDPEADVRAAAVRSLPQYVRAQAAAVAPVLARAIADPDPRVRRASAAGMRGLAPYSVVQAAALIAATNDDDKGVRTEALLALGYAQKHASAAVVRALSEARRDPDPEIQSAATQALRLTGARAKEELPALVHTLRNGSDYGPRRDALDVLVALGRAAEPALPVLVETLRDPDSRLRSGAIVALAEIGPASMPVLPAMLDALKTIPLAECPSVAFHLQRMGADSQARIMALLRAKDTDPGLRMALAFAVDLRSRPELAVPLLAEELRSPDKAVRFFAARALGNARGAAATAVPSMATALADPDPSVRLELASILLELGTAARPATRALEVALEDREPYVRATAAAALSKILSDPAFGLPVILPILEDWPNRSLDRSAALRALEGRGRAAGPAVPALTRLLAEGGRTDRHSLILLLAEIGPAARTAAPAIRKYLDDPDEWVRKAAQKALMSIETEEKTAP
jgi:HEAT repeat protein